MNARLIIFTRYPEPGITKTRLIPVLGEEGAADLQRAMTEHTLETVRPLAGPDLDLEVRFAGGDGGAMAAWLGEDLPYAPQGEGDLGARMERVFREAFAAGRRKAVIIGTDCPDLAAADIRAALDLLGDNPMVLGPATDGGYYLVALHTGAPGVVYERAFAGIPWGTSTVFADTMNALAGTLVDVGLLDEKADVDEPADLIHWELVRDRAKSEERRAKDCEHLEVSVIIPVLNEEDRIGETISRLRKADLEIVVADGGSSDRTVEICRERGVKVVGSQPGRARQLNAGAAAAGGDILLFLHADTRLPPGFEGAVRDAVFHGAAAGAFSFETDLSGATMDIVTAAAHFRSHRLGVVFGDQAIFATRPAFLATGGFPDQPVMEDYELWRRLKKEGPRVILPEAAVTSSRRWQENGLWRTTFANQVVTWGYLLFKVSPDRLAKWYVEFLEKGKREEGGE